MYSLIRQKDIFRQLAEIKLKACSTRNDTTESAASISKGAATPAVCSGGYPVNELETAPLDGDVDHADGAAQAGDCQNGGPATDTNTIESWMPTEEWLEGVKKSMSLQTILCMTDYLTVQIDRATQN